MFKRFLEKINFSERNLPLAIIAAGILAFGLQIPSLGFFQDDWHFIHYGSAAGAQGMLEFLTMDGRPTAAWVYALGYPLLGFSPLPWHVLSLTLRLVTVLLAFRVLQTIFPERTRTNALATFFFLLYPAFTLQPQAVVYTEHWTSFALFFFSLLMTLRAIENPKRWLPYTALAIIATTLHLFTVEYFVGLELLRPLAIWMMITKQKVNVVASVLQRAKQPPPHTGDCFVGKSILLAETQSFGVLPNSGSPTSSFSSSSSTGGPFSSAVSVCATTPRARSPSKPSSPPCNTSAQTQRWCWSHRGSS